MHSTRRFVPIVVVALIGSSVLATCSSPAEVRPVAPGDTAQTKPPPITVTSLAIQGPGAIQVNENWLLVLTAYGPKGAVIGGLPDTVIWRTDDGSVVNVSRGTVRGLRRGTAHVTARYGTIETTVAVSVKARLRVLADYTEPTSEWWFGGKDDSLHLTADYVDVDGKAIAAVPAIQWSSSSPQLASVDSTGLVVGRAFAGPSDSILITAAATDDTTSGFLHVPTAGLPASVRLANGNPGGPLTFVPSQGPPITLRFGEFADIPLRSGVFTVRIDGYRVDNPWHSSLAKPGGYRGLIREGESTALYVVPGNTAAALVLTHTVPHALVPAAQSLIQVIQGSAMGVVYLRGPSELAIGAPDLCYFDPGDDATLSRAPGSVDIIGAPKYAAGIPARFEINALGGRQTTIVLIGGKPEEYRIVEFPNP